MTSATVPTKRRRRKKLHERISKHVHDLIREGKLRPGDALPSERDLARQFSVSHVTVRKGLSVLVEQGLIDRKVGRGTYVSDGQSRPKERITSKRKTIAIATSHVQADLPMVGYCLSSLDKILDRNEYALEVVGIPPHGADEAFFDFIEEHQFSGIIYGGYLGENDCNTIAKLNLPVVSIGGHVAATSVGHIHVHYEGIFDELIREIYRFGHQQIALITWHHKSKETLNASIVDASEVLPAYATACRRYNLLQSAQHHYKLAAIAQPDPLLLDTRMLFELDNKPTCVIVNDEVMTSAFIRDAEVAGIRVPEDISIVSLFDSTPNLHRVPLTAAMTLDAISQRCQQAGSLLRCIIEGQPDVQLHQPYMPKIEYRASLAPAPGWRINDIRKKKGE